MKRRSQTQSAAPTSLPHRIIARHLRIGWWTLLIFTGMGLGLEAAHGFKLPWYLGVAAETRRLTWTLAHAHGSLFGLLHIAFALTLRTQPPWPTRRIELASGTLTSGSLLLPGGFFLGGLFPRGGDPGLGVLLVPIGAVLFLVALGLVVASLRDDAVSPE